MIKNFIRSTTKVNEDDSLFEVAEPYLRNPKYKDSFLKAAENQPLPWFSTKIEVLQLMSNYKYAFQTQADPVIINDTIYIMGKEQKLL